MRVDPTLGSKDFEHALSILKTEQEANMPSRRQMLYFRLFNLFIYLFVGFSVIYTVLEIFVNFSSGVALLIGVLEGILFLPIIPLLFLNLGFMLKLKRYARLRKRLHLDKGLKDTFTAHRRSLRIRNLWALLISLPGYFLAILGLLFVVGSIFLSFEKDMLSASGIVFGIGIALTLLGLSFIFLHFMRRGKQRLDVVRDLRASLSKYEKVFEKDKLQRINIDAKEYDEIARIERTQIIRDRQRSIHMGSKKASMSGYLMQKSREILAAEARLDLNVRLLVENQILRLTIDPFPSGYTMDSDTGTIRLHVPDTAVEIVYQVDQDNRRISLFSLQKASSGDSSEQKLGE